MRVAAPCSWHSAICGAAAVWAAMDRESPRALDAHVARTLVALEAFVIPCAVMPQLTESIAFV